MFEPGTKHPKIRKAVLKDLPNLQLVFLRSITELARQDYTPSQVQSWGDSIKNQDRWVSIISDQYCLLAIHQNQKTMGFGTLKRPDYIDLLYVDPNFCRQGIAQHLFLALQKQALKEGAKVLQTHASVTAKPFFEKQGFKVLAENMVSIKEEELLNYHMKKFVVP